MNSVLSFNLWLIIKPLFGEKCFDLLKSFNVFFHPQMNRFLDTIATKFNRWDVSFAVYSDFLIIDNS